MGSFPLRSGNPIETFLDWSRIYGDIFCYRSLYVRVYFLNDPAAIESVLVTRSHCFVKGRGLQANRALFGNGLLTSEGEFWRRQRRLAQPAFHQDRMEAYSRTIVELGRQAIQTWGDGLPHDWIEEFSQLTLAIAGRTLFGAEVGGNRELMRRAFHAVAERNTRGHMLIPVLRSLPLPVNRRYRRAVRELDGLIYRIIADRRRASERPNDLLGMLLEARDETGQHMTDRQLRDEVMTVILAGHETTALALGWTFYLLAKHPQVEERLAAEIEGALKGNPPTAASLARMPYLEQVLKESLRLYPPAYILTRTAIEPCEVGGYVIPIGATVLISPWVMHRNPRFYKEPEIFNPDRWNDAGKSGNGNAAPRFAYLPFGGGPRVCIGAAFALMEARLLIASILQRFRFELAPKPPVEPLPVITLRPRHGLWGTFMDRGRPGG
jgi:cytochrome P450